jgi:streptogramin lyase
MKFRAITRAAVLALAGSLVSVGTASAAGAGQIVARYALAPPGGVGFLRYDATDHLLWTVDVGNDQLVALAPLTGQVVHRVALPANLPSQEYDGLEVGLGRVWLTNFNDGGPAPLVEVDPASGTIVNGAGYSTHGNGPEGIAFLDGDVWVANHHQDASGTSGSVVELDPATGQEIRHLMIGAQQDCCGPQYMVAAAGSVWVEVPNLGAVVRVTPTSGGGSTNDAIPVGSPARAFNVPDAACGPLVSAAGSVFFSDGGCTPSDLGRIDTPTEGVTEWPEDGSVYGLASGLGSIWAALAGEGQGRLGTFLARIDPSTGTILGKTKIGSQAGPADVAVDTTDGLIYVLPFSGQLVAVRP